MVLLLFRVSILGWVMKLVLFFCVSVFMWVSR